jgi:hypothetical protein
MKERVIILTYGLSGSSVLAGLLTRAGYWPGDATYKKPDYDTFENVRLIEANRQLITAANYKGDHEHEFSADALQHVAALWNSIDRTPFERFVADCDRHRPWVWKDPRLWLSIRFWEHLLPKRDVTFILLTRSLAQLWASCNLRRRIYTMSYIRRYHGQIEASMREFLASRHAQFGHVVFDELIARPEKVLRSLNQLLGTSLTRADLAAVYTEPLGRRSHGALDFAKAALVHAKNFGERRG